VTFLLDTHAFLWFVLNDSKLSLTAKTTIEVASNQILVSPANYWEIAIKISCGKYRLNDSFEAFWEKGMNENQIAVLPITLNHTAQLLDMPYHHKDPFDRLLIAQALAEGIPLVSSDARFDAYSVQRIW
jgi:PIN domain nuclease of toxin-antitoxin system